MLAHKRQTDSDQSTEPQSLKKQKTATQPASSRSSKAKKETVDTQSTRSTNKTSGALLWELLIKEYTPAQITDFFHYGKTNVDHIDGVTQDDYSIRQIRYLQLKLLTQKTFSDAEKIHHQGIIHLAGLNGKPASLNDAMKYYRKAANANYIPALLTLSSLYIQFIKHNKLTKETLAKYQAYKNNCIENAAKLGSLKAKLILAIEYTQQGSSTKMQIKTAFNYFDECIKHRMPEAYLQVAMLWLKATDIPKNEQTALKYFDLLFHSNHAKSLYMAFINLRHENTVLAKKFLLKAVELNYSHAEMVFAAYSYTGMFGLEQNPLHAETFIAKYQDKYPDVRATFENFLYPILTPQQKQARIPYYKEYAGQGQLWAIQKLINILPHSEEHMQYCLLAAAKEDPIAKNMLSIYLVQKKIKDPEIQKRCFNYLKEIAAPEKPYTIFRLATCYLDGIGTERNITAAFKTVRYLKQKNPKLFHKLTADLHFKLNRYDDAIRHYKIAASAKYITAIGLIAQTYEAMGNHELAFKYFKKSAKYKIPHSAFKAGMMLKDGIGCEKDLEQAYQYFHFACTKSYKNPLPNYYVAVHLSEKPSARNEEIIHAAQHFQAAIKYRHNPSQIKLSELLIKYKKLFKMTPEEFNSHMEAAAICGSSKAKIEVAALRLKGQHNAASLERLRRLIQPGVDEDYPKALYLMALTLLKDTRRSGKEARQTQAIDLMHRAEKRGYPDATMFLAQAYKKGKLVPSDMDRAFSHYLKAFDLVDDTPTYANATRFIGGIDAFKDFIKRNNIDTLPEKMVFSTSSIRYEISQLLKTNALKLSNAFMQHMFLTGPRSENGIRNKLGGCEPATKCILDYLSPSNP